MSYIFKKLSHAGSGSGGFIEVDQFPTEGVDTGSVYKASETISVEPKAYAAVQDVIVTLEDFIEMNMGVAAKILLYVVESIPDVMEPFDQTTFTIPAYVVESTGIGYVSQDGTPDNVTTLGTLLGARDFDKGWVDSEDSLQSIDLSDRNNWGVYCVRGGERTIFSYGLPRNADLRSIKEYTTDDGWKTIINRVDVFPTENIEDEAVYQIRKEVDELLDVWVVEGEFSGNLVDFGETTNLPVTAKYYLVDELPESPTVSTGSSSGVYLHVYIIRDTGEPFVLMSAGGVCQSLGDAILDGLSFNGIIIDSAYATSEGVYTIMREAGFVTSYGIPNADGRKKVYEQYSDGTWVNPGAETARLKAENETLTNANAALETEKETLTSEKAALETEKETLTSEKDALEAENETLTAEKVALEEEVDSMALNATRGKAVVEAGEGGVTFAKCALLSKIDTGIKLTEIEDRTITNIAIPNDVTYIEHGAFFGCSALESITLPFVGYEVRTASDTYQYPFGFIFGSSRYTGGVAISQMYHRGSITQTTIGEYYIPETLKSVTVTGGNILCGAFQQCANLTNIVIPEGVTSIGDYAFCGCLNLASFIIPNGVVNIGNNAFNSCNSLTSIAIPDSVTSIGELAFSNCIGLTDITIGSGVTSIGERAFQICTSLTSIAIPDGVTSIDEYTFSNCTSMQYYDFTSHTAVPTLVNTNAFDNIPSTCEIRVPAALYDEWIAAENWATYADNIVAV